MPDQTATDLLQAMTGQNVVISNETLTCMDTANAIFNFTGSALGISDGILLYTGRVDQISNPWNFALTHVNNTPVTPMLQPRSASALSTPVPWNLM